MHIAIITAGGAGMFCGSCMHDNTWARALQQAGCQVTLLPTYTPIRLDEPDQSSHPIFLGGLNVYLDQQLPGWRRLPRGLTRWLDTPWLINFATRFSTRYDARKLGELALSMLAGEAGPQRREMDELANFIAHELRPDAVVFSNALLAGALRLLKSSFTGPVYCTLQGDDVFLDMLPESHRRRAIDAVSERAQDFDGFLVHTRFYRDYMARYLSLDAKKFHLIPLGIDLTGHNGEPGARTEGPFTVGYFARIARQKGLHRLVEAFVKLHRRLPDAQLRVGGFLGGPDRAYFKEVCRAAKPLGSAFEYVGSPATHAEKVAFFQSIDVLSVPTEFLEPKGLYVLEALANGVPVVQPRHGAFPELIEATGGGRLVTPGDADELADALEELATDPDTRYSLGAAGQINVREQFNPQVLAARTLEVLRDDPGHDRKRG
ncbi:MAG: glycosyltransferase family 4 protein [Planctomycetaceae bacterium]